MERLKISFVLQKNRVKCGLRAALVIANHLFRHAQETKPTHPCRAAARWENLVFFLKGKEKLAKKPNQLIVEKPTVKVGWLWRDFAKEFGIGINRVARDISSGRLRAKRIGRVNFVTFDAAKAYFDALPDTPVGVAPPERLTRPDVVERRAASIRRRHAERAARTAAAAESN